VELSGTGTITYNRSKMGVTVLIVDDDEGVRFFHKISVLHSNLSTDCLTFKNAQEAMDYLNAHGNGINTYLILLDINMPCSTGWDFLDAIKNESYSNQIHVVMVTSSVDPADRERAKIYKMVLKIVEKPISDEECKAIFNFPSIAPFFQI
jgi:CheY-like chemotaxis protein